MEKFTERFGNNEGMIEEILGVLRDELNELGGEYNLTSNPYGFVTAWLEEGVEVWWDKDSTAFKMDELTELCALHETILRTVKEIEDDEERNG